MIQRKKHQQFKWTEKTDSAVERYIKWESKPHIQQRIYKEHIEIPLRNISKRLVKEVMFFNKGERLMEYDPYNDSSYFDDEKISTTQSYSQEIENLIDECVSFFFTTLFPYIKNGSIDNNFAYINSSIKHYLISTNIERTRNSIGGMYLEELPEQNTEKDYYFILYKKNMSVPSFESELDNETIYIGEMLSYWDKNIPLIWNKENQSFQRRVATNVIELMRRNKQIKHFKVDSMRRYLRKMMDWEKGTNIYSGTDRNKFNRVIRFMRDRNKLLRTQYRTKGMIDFYYI
tara:strand:- start:211 stop:1074 length:864 start_codon:yes stop_codon:yes gene_type:complete